MIFPLNSALRITYIKSILCAGLDSADPLFSFASSDGRLDPSDAVLVDTIHTSSDFLGIREPYGHVDFYPNKGATPQPGCDGLDIFGESAWVNVYSLVQFPQNGVEDEVSC